MKTLKKLNLVFILAMAGMVIGCTQDKKGGEATEETATQEAVEETAAPNSLTEKEKADGWILLFDGESSNSWRGFKKDAFPKDWEIVDGTLHMKGSGRGEAGSAEGGDIIYDKKFSNFDLKLQWKISEGGNSGIFYLGQELPQFEEIWRTAPEYQVLDNERHMDANLGKDGNRKSASLYDLIPAVPQNAKPAGEWNTAEIIVYKGTVVHKQNGETVLEYHLWTPEWNELVGGSKFPEYNEDWANVAQEGYIGLQDHGDDVWYRDIKIKEL